MADQITLTLPADPGYTPSIRLLLSGLASHMDFPVDAIEDIRTCAAEACLLLLHGQKCTDIVLMIEAGDALKVQVVARDVTPDPDVAFEDFSEEISRIMIEALSDECVFAENEGLLCEVGFTKRREENAGTAK